MNVQLRSLKNPTSTNVSMDSWTISIYAKRHWNYPIILNVRLIIIVCQVQWGILAISIVRPVCMCRDVKSRVSCQKDPICHK